jgi:hypothetical protein
MSKKKQKQTKPLPSSNEEPSMAEDICEGLFCESCGVFIDDSLPGHSRQCENCDAEKS